MGILKVNSSLVNANKVSVERTNLGGGKLSLSKFNASNISNIALWTKQGSLTSITHYIPAYVTFYANYAGGDIDTTFNEIDEELYQGSQFGFNIYYNQQDGMWYLTDPDENEIANSEDLLGQWITYGSLSDFEVSDWDYNSATPANEEFIWSDVSGKNNHLTTRKNPINNGILSTTIKNLETKLSRTPFKTTNTINAFLPFTIYVALIDIYTGTLARTILGIKNILHVQSSSHNNLYHTFSLRYYNSGWQTICSFYVRKNQFAFTSYGPSILKISSSYRSTSASPIRAVTLSYYNLYSDSNKTLGSLSANGTASFDTNSSAGNLYLGNSTFGNGNLAQTTAYPNGKLYLSEVLVYNKSLSTEEDGTINRYLQRKYYGKLLS